MPVRIDVKTCVLAALHRTLMPAYRAGLCLALVSTSLIGCSDGRPERVVASGKVTIDGSPLKYGSVLFLPEKGRPAAGSLDTEGRFSLTCYEPGDGIIPGTYRVQIKGTEAIGEDAQRWHAPMKYSRATESGIEFEISEPTDSLLIELTWDGGKPFVEKFH